MNFYLLFVMCSYYPLIIYGAANDSLIEININDNSTYFIDNLSKLANVNQWNNNISTINNYNDKSSGMWSKILEEWTTSSQSERESRAVQIAQRYMPYSGGFHIIKRRNDNNCRSTAAPPLSFPYKFNSNNNNININNNNNNNNRLRSSKILEDYKQREYFKYNCDDENNHHVKSTNPGVTETDLYLLAAIEKLVYRVDYLESRLRRTEQLVYYLMAGNKEHHQSSEHQMESSEQQQQQLQHQHHHPHQQPQQNKEEIDERYCPKNYKKIGTKCYHIEMNQKVNWKTANELCKPLGGNLIEFETSQEKDELFLYLLNIKQLQLNLHDFWTSGLNPGLLWIWSNSARPIIETPTTNNNLTSVEEKIKNSNKINIKGDGRCLMLSYNTTIYNYEFIGHECDMKINFICKLSKHKTDNEI